MSNHYQDELLLATEAAKTAGLLIKKKFNRHKITETKSCSSDLVTEVDRECEEIIVHLIQEHFPTHKVVGEEQYVDHDQITNTNPTWYIDPLDGTTNFVFGLTFCAISIALAYKGVPVLGVIHDPFRKETFSAVQGCGAYLNGSPITVDQAKCTLDGSLLVTGYPGNIALRPRMHRVNYEKVIDQCNNLRALGSAALELAYVACGRLTGFWEVSLRPWDVAAGMVLVEEAGGTISDLAGQPLLITEYIDITASNGLIHQEFLECLAWKDEHHEK